MKLQKFSESYPYLTSKGIEISKREMDTLATELLTKFHPRGREFGLELAYLLLWVQDHVTDKEAYFPVAAKLFGQMIRRKTFAEKSQGKTKELDESYIDTEIIDKYDLWEMEEDFNSLLGGKYTIEELLSIDRRDRHREVKRLKEIVNESS